MTYLLDVERNDNPLKSKFVINRQRAAVPRPQRVFGPNNAEFSGIVHLQGCVNFAKPLPEDHRFGDALRALDEGTGESDVSPIKTRFEERTIAAMSLGVGLEPIAPRAPPHVLMADSNEGDAVS
jgi:hypothetical protein